ncbi:MAG: hypothetical protein Q8L15_18350 [Methylobacter sp.]|nr:hypothetical protein [Methylobacter sp.]
MKHISEYMLEITQLQTLLQNRLDDQDKLFVELSSSPDSISTLATIPKIEADLCVSRALNDRINRNIQAVNAHV